MLKVGMTFASIFLLAGEPLKSIKTCPLAGKGKDHEEHSEEHCL